MGLKLSDTGKASKFIVAVLGTISAGLTTYYHGSPKSNWVPIVVEGITALGVYLIPNTVGTEEDEPVQSARSQKL
jgi:hypothetical protein